MSEFRRNMGVAREYNFNRTTGAQGEGNEEERLPDILTTSPKSGGGGDHGGKYHSQLD
jgi:hypothetical protein